MFVLPDTVLGRRHGPVVAGVLSAQPRTQAFQECFGDPRCVEVRPPIAVVESVFNCVERVLSATDTALLDPFGEPPERLYLQEVVVADVTRVAVTLGAALRVRVPKDGVFYPL